jgi:ABC-2 type transport system permease protein
MSKNIIAIFKRELAGYFETPVAYVFIGVFLLLNGMLTFYMGRFYEAGQANLNSFFMWHPWIFLFLIPAISMRLWSEERKSGTMELLMTLPVSSSDAVIGKYLAAWCFALIAIFLTFPTWLTVNYLGSPDNGTILAGYLASILVSGGFLAIGSCISALTKNQVVAFVISVAVCFIFNISGLPVILNFFSALGFSQTMLDTISSFSFLTNFLEISRGVISLSNIIYFLSIMSFWLVMNVIAVECKRS